MEIVNVSGHRYSHGKEIIKKLPMFNIHNVKRLVDAYSSATNVHCVVVDTEGQCVYGANLGSSGICQFCQLMQEIIGQNLSCTDVHRYGIYQSERFEGKYTFFCPLGLVHWASPLMIDKQMAAAFLGGPVLLYDREEVLADLIGKYKLEGENAEQLQDLLGSIPLVDHSRLSSLTEMMHIMSSSVSEDETRLYLKQKDDVERIENLNDYLPYLQTMGGENSMQNYPIDLERELLAYISTGDKKLAKKTLNEILGHIFFSSTNNYEVIKARVLELVVLLSRAALEGGASTEEIFGLNFRYINEIQKFRTVDQLAVWLSKIMGRFSDCVFDLKDVKHVDVIYKALEYIKKNHMNKITLKDVANVSNISPSYFSKVFKEEMGKNFNNYLNEVRVNSAKRFLVDDSIPLVDVAFMTGFEDQSYFSKVFKKITGISPGKYRESMGRIITDKTG